ncbi:hypothetical protein NVP1084O_213 [Vibrio phage 1.084.O._10N.261.49.F5]|nr:hypothetical protein NVP1084O_213 [Vibrio phage 1.084.O._10N.261.49.F5]
MISLEQFSQMKEATRCLIQVVFQHEKEFKRDILKQIRFPADSYELERVHISGSVIRIEIKFEDYSTYNIYEELDRVIDWYYKMAEENK